MDHITKITATTWSRAATAGKALKVWTLPKCWVSIPSYKKQPVKKICGRILGLAWPKFAVASLNGNSSCVFQPYNSFF